MAPAGDGYDVALAIEQTQTVGPIFLRAGYPTDVRRGFFGRIEPTRTRKETARADAVTVTVEGPPAAGRPPSYTGAIGRYSMDVSAKPDRVEKGQPITLTVAIRGEPLAGVAGPDLGANAELASRFDYARDDLLGDIERNRRVFRRAVFPKQEGEQSIPAVTWSFFDPNSIAVDPATLTTTSIALSNGEDTDAQETELTLLGGGISPNYVDTSMVLANQAFVLTPVWMSALAFPPVICLVVSLTARHRSRLHGDKGLARRRHARRNALARIAGVSRSKGTLEQLHGLSEALTEYLADRFNLPPGAVTPSEARDLVAEEMSDDTVADELASFLEECDQSRYAPTSADETSVAAAVDRVRAWIGIIERGSR